MNTLFLPLCLTIACLSMMLNSFFLTLFPNPKIKAFGWTLLGVNSVMLVFLMWALAL